MKKGLIAKLIFIAAVVAILCAAFTLTSSAVVCSGSCGANGDNVKWSLDTDTGVLNITGTGYMANYYSSNGAPWYSNRKAFLNTGKVRARSTFFRCLRCGKIPSSPCRCGPSINFRRYSRKSRVFFLFRIRRARDRDGCCGLVDFCRRKVLRRRELCCILCRCVYKAPWYISFYNLILHKNYITFY